MKYWHKLSRRKKIVALAGLAFLVVSVTFRLASSRNGEEAVKYRSVVIKRGPITVTIVATGVVQPQNRVAVKPPITGRVEQLLVRDGDVVKQGQVMAWMSSTERAAVLDAARSRGPEEVKSWEELYRPTAILAPVNGTIIQRNMQPGQSFSSSDSVFVISDRLILKTLVDETDIAQIGKGQSAKIRIDAYPQEPLNGRVDHIAFDAKTINSITTYEADVVPLNAPAFLRSGMTANVTFEIASKSDALLIPAEAVQLRDGKPTCNVPSGAPGMGVNQVEIQPGISDGKFLEAREGLKEGDTILIPEMQWDGKDQNSGIFVPRKTGE